MTNNIREAWGFIHYRDWAIDSQKYEDKPNISRRYSASITTTRLDLSREILCSLLRNVKYTYDRYQECINKSMQLHATGDEIRHWDSATSLLV